MKNPIIDYLAHNQFLTTLIVLALIWLAAELSGILIIIFISYIIMAALSPFADFLIKKRIPRILSVLIPYTTTIAVLVLLIFPLVPFFASQIEILFSNFPIYINQIAKTFNLDINVSNVDNVFQSDINTIGKNALSVTGKIFSGAFSMLAVFVISFYLMLQREMLKEQFIAFFPKKYQEKVLKTVAQIENKIGLWLRGQMILSFTIGFSTWAGLTLLGLPFALPLGLLAGILEIVPTIGPIISAVPAIIVALTISPGVALSVVIFYILLQMVENNILVPKIMQKAVGLNPIVVIIGVLIGSKFLGVLGALLAVPFIAMVLIIAKSFKSSN
ncbi:MAG: AI-2E family transporter [Candidatus Levybacteria bacterium]|nr:AI-2E family transporter [Candidatus Levybacteria bacterium]